MNFLKDVHFITKEDENHIGRLEECMDFWPNSLVNVSLAYEKMNMRKYLFWVYIILKTQMEYEVDINILEYATEKW